MLKRFFFVIYIAFSWMIINSCGMKGPLYLGNDHTEIVNTDIKIISENNDN